MVKEALALAYSLNHWKHFLLRRKFSVDTDHASLVHLFNGQDESAPVMRKKQIFITLRAAISMFHFELKHLAGSKNILADYLSRDGNLLNDMDNSARKVQIDHTTIGSSHLQPKELNCTTAQWTQTLKNMAVLRARHHINCMTITPSNTVSYLNYHKASDTGVPDSLRHLDLLYLKEHGRAIATPIKDTQSDPNWPVTVIPEDYDFSSKKWNPKEIPRKSALSNRSLLQVDRKHKYKTTDINNIKFRNQLHNNLRLAIQNTAENALSTTHHDPTITSHHVNLTAHLHQLYHSPPQQNSTSNSLNLPFVGEINTNEVKIRTQNFNQNSERLRRSTRKRKKVIPLWDQPAYYDPLYGKNQPLANSATNANHSRDPPISNPFAYTGERPPQRETHQIVFPYNVSLKLSEALCNKIYLPEKYGKHLTLANVSKIQKGDAICQHIINCVVHNTKTSYDYLYQQAQGIYNLVKAKKFQILNDTIYVGPTQKYPYARLFIPEGIVHSILDYVHQVNNFNHPGVSQMNRIISEKFYWDGMTEDIRTYVRQCRLCQEGKGSISHKTGKLQPVVHAKQRGELVHFDFAGPFYGKLHILVMVDNYTGAVILHPCTSESAESIVFALMYRWYPVHGLPVQLLTDRGTGFVSRANRMFCKALGIDKIFTSAYHPETNAKAERVVQELKKALRMLNLSLDQQFTKVTENTAQAKINQLISEIKLVLPSIQFNLNQKIHTVTHVSPHMLMYGRNLRDIVDLKLARKYLEKLPSFFEPHNHYDAVKQVQAAVELAKKNRDNVFEKYVLKYKEYFDVNKNNDKFEIDDVVAYFTGDSNSTNKKLRSRFSGPWQITDRIRPNVVTIQRDGHKLSVHTKMLKHYFPDKFEPMTKIRRENRENELIEATEINNQSNNNTEAS